MLEAALEYAARGWLIFPVPPGTKAGYSKDKHLNDNPWGCTSSETEIRKYWARLPSANIGLVMGIGSGIFDIEIDTPEGHNVDGAASLAKLEQWLGKLPPTLMFVSPSGSVHRLYRHPGGDVQIRSGALDAANYPGIDVKADGGMSIMPPSRTRKGVYKWINKRRIAPAPEWLLAMVIRAARAPRGELNPFERFAREAKQADIAKVTLAIAMIPNDLATSRATWVKVGYALWSATGGSEEGYELFLAWSRRWPGGFNEENTRTLWIKVREMPHSITAGTIFFLAEQAMPDYLQRCISLDPDVIALLENFRELIGEPE
jgi:Bifunctional DNA primase/polymerase, N-terminal/Primase C terminal 2 (PriCT-2)